MRIVYLLAAFILSGCVMIEKNIYVLNSEEIGIEYTTRSSTKADLQDLLDLKIPLIP